MEGAQGWRKVVEYDGGEMKWRKEEREVEGTRIGGGGYGGDEEKRRKKKKKKTKKEELEKSVFHPLTCSF